jgi:hypothetical protein
MITVEWLKFIKIRRNDEISACLNLNEAMTGAVAKNIVGLWINMTGECSSASLAGSRLIICQLNILSAGKRAMLTWVSKFK